jgi:hypothetical protein
MEPSTSLYYVYFLHCGTNETVISGEVALQNDNGYLSNEKQMSMKVYWLPAHYVYIMPAYCWICDVELFALCKKGKHSPIASLHRSSSFHFTVILCNGVYLIKLGKYSRQKPSAYVPAMFSNSPYQKHLCSLAGNLYIQRIRVIEVDLS